MSYTLSHVNGICHHVYDNPPVICFRDVANDAQVSPWFEWQGISQDISMDEFFKEVEDCNLSTEKLSIRALEDKKGIIIDYGLRHQFWIPIETIKNNKWDLDYLRTSLKDRLEKENIELKPCPFCGCDAEITVCQELSSVGDEGFVIRCTNSECGVSTTNINGGYSAYKQDIIEIWNRRCCD